MAAEDEVVEICRDLLRIDTSNYGDGSGPGERKAAEHVVALLDEVGPRRRDHREPTPAGRSVVLRVEGEDAGRDALLLHGHLDVVPAEAADWQVDPFSGEERDGCLWGRGAVDMKDMDAMMLARCGRWRAPARGRPATWSSPSSPTRRPAAPRAPGTWSTPDRSCSTA